MAPLCPNGQSLARGLLFLARCPPLGKNFRSNVTKSPWTSPRMNSYTNERAIVKKSKPEPLNKDEVSAKWVSSRYRPFASRDSPLWDKIPSKATNSPFSSPTIKPYVSQRVIVKKSKPQRLQKDEKTVKSAHHGQPDRETEDKRFGLSV